MATLTNACHCSWEVISTGLRVDLGTAFAPVGGNLLDLFALDVGDDQPRLLGLEARNDGFANALGGAGDDHHFVLQPLAIGWLGHGGE
jgi:hypothetical protein